MNEIPTTELGFVDIRKYVYDSLVNYVPIIEKIGTENVFVREEEKINKKQRPFVSISGLGGDTDSTGIRTQAYQIDVWATSIEESEKIKDIIVDLFNRRNFKGIESRLIRIGPDMSNPKTGLFRQILDFRFVFKDTRF